MTLFDDNGRHAADDTGPVRLVGRNAEVIGINYLKHIQWLVGIAVSLMAVGAIAVTYLAGYAKKSDLDKINMSLESHAGILQNHTTALELIKWKTDEIYEEVKKRDVSSR